MRYILSRFTPSQRKALMAAFALELLFALALAAYFLWRNARGQG